MARDNRRVIEFTPGPQFRAPPAKRKRKRKPQEQAKDHDPRLKVPNRTFEIVQVHVLAEMICERRLRIRIDHGGLEDQLYDVGGKQCYCGLVSEQLDGRDKWSPYTWGHVPVVSDTGWVREIIDNDKPPVKPVAHHDKDEKK